MTANKKKGPVGVIVWAIVSILLVAVLITLTVLENGMLKPILTTVLGGQMPKKDPSVEAIYKSDYASKEASKEAGDKLNVEICEEGFILLLNEDEALPIKTPASDSSVTSKPKVSVFGKNSVDLVLGGSGSGGLSGVEATSLYDSLTDSGFEFNPTLKAFYEDDKASGAGRSDSPELTEGSDKSPTLDIGETPIGSYTAEVRGSIKEYSDAAIIVISRLGGESWDLPREQNVSNGGIEGNHYLQLDENEYALFDFVTARFNKVIVVLNTLTSFQCDFIEEYNNTATDKRIDAVLWIGGPGVTGAAAFGKILNGSVNPSGKTTDLYSKDFTLDPTWQNFGDNSQVNGGKNGSAYLENGSALAGQFMVAYEEGVYVGYRYYETRAYEELLKDEYSTWYQDNVVFPFGHGLSYTKFDQEIVSVSGGLTGISSALTIKVKSTNVGSVAGKDVIELYVSLPYKRGGIEKSYVQLVDFGKTPLLKVGESFTATFTVEAYDLSSYDYNDANNNNIKGYELEAGDYEFFVSKDSHVAENAYDQRTVTLDADLYFANDTTTNTPVINRYTTEDTDDLQYRLSDVLVNGKKRKGMSRTDFVGTFPTPFTDAERELKEVGGIAEKEALENKSTNNTVISGAAMPTTGKSGTVTLRDLVGKPYNDDLWNDLLDRLTFEQMLELVNNGAFQTAAIESIDKNLTNDSDGPIGFVNFMPGLSDHYKGNTTFACEIVIGSTWNKDLAYQMGEIVGENGLYGDVSGNGLPYTGWYAPAVNLHRSPFAGRNFEYYSEDPVISGKLAIGVINGTAQKGVYTDLKHFALNDQETNRSGISTFCTEQALRELYLKPFEMAVKGDDDPNEVPSAKADGITKFQGTTGIMSSFNRIGTRWTGGDYRLVTEILRNEWGYRGLVICDYKTDNSFMDSRQMLYAGNDLILASVQNLLWNDASATSAEDVAILRLASHNILYTVANSNSVNVKIIGYSTEWWITLTIVLDIVIPLLLAVWGFFVIKGFIKGKKAE